MPRRRVAAHPFAAMLGTAAVLILAACGSSPSTTSGSAGRGGTTSTRVVTSPSSAKGTSRTTSTSGAREREVAFDPYTARGTILPTMHVTQTVTGTCVSPGVAGSSSYRCFAQPGSTTYDPCFAPPHATSGPLVCVADPAETQVVSFDVGTLPTTSTSGPATQPWAMQLSNGQSCIFVAAAWGAGLGPFACPTPAGSSPSEADCHAPRRSGNGFEAACQASETSSSSFQPVQVVKVWT